MKLVNNRYKIIECVEQNHNFSKFVVTDLIKQDTNILLYVINDTEIMKTFIDYCTKNFYKFSSFSHPNIISIYSYGVIENIDGKFVNELKFYYTTEYIDKKLIYNTEEPLARKTLQDLYVQISRAIDFLHFHGIVYRYLSIDSLIIYKDHNQLKVQLLDLITLKNNSLCRNYINSHEINFNSFAPEFYDESEIGRYTDVYSIGSILYYFLNKKLLKHADLIRELKRYNNSDNYEYHIYRLIEEMTRLDYIKRIQTIHEANERIEKIFKENITIKDKSTIEKLNFRTPIIGRKNELQKIESVISSNKSKEVFNKDIVLIHGVKGIGKTRLITEALYKMELKKINTVRVKLTEKNSSFKKVMPNLLKQFYKRAPIELVEKYSSELVKLTPEIVKNSLITPSKELSQDKEILRLYDRVANFIIEFSSKKPTVISIDDFQYADHSLLEFFDYLLNSNRLKKSPILNVLSYCEESKLTKNLKRWIKKDSTLHIKLSRLSVEESALLMKHILGYYRVPIEFASKLMTQIEGLPGNIEEILRHLFTNKLLTIKYDNDNKSFYWSINERGYSQVVKLSQNYDESILTEISSFDTYHRKVLEVVSTFSTSVSRRIVKQILGPEDEYIRALENLTRDRILNEKLEDWGYTYGFMNKQIKNYIYVNIPEHQKINLHIKASKILEDSYLREGRGNKDELIYHLTHSNQISKVIDYYIESGNNMLNHRIYSQALEFYQKANELLVDINDHRKQRLRMNIAKIYQKQGKNQEAIEVYTLVKDYAIENELKELMIDVQNKIAQSNLNKNNIDAAVELLNHNIKKAEQFKYKEGLLEAGHYLSKAYILHRKTSELGQVCDKFLELAYSQNNDTYIGIFLSQKATESYLKGKQSQAIKLLEESIQYLEKAKLMHKTADPINSIGLIYLEYYQDFKNAKRYFKKALTISQQYHKMEDMITAYNNIADAYILNGNFEAAVEVLNNNILPAVEYEDDIVRFVVYIKQITCYLYLEEYKKAYLCLNKAQSTVAKLPIQSVHSASYFEAAAKFYNVMGCYDLVENTVNYFNDTYRHVDQRIKLRMDTIKFVSRNSTKQDVTNSEVFEILNKYEETSFGRDKRVFLFIAILYFYDKGDISTAKKLYNEFLELVTVIDNEFFQIRSKYLKGILLNNKEGILELEDLISSDVHIVNEMKWRIYDKLGDLCCKSNELFKATNYYISALDTLKATYFKTPEEFQYTYLLNEKKYEIKAKLLNMRQLINKDHSPILDNFIREENKNLFFDLTPLQSLMGHPKFYKLALDEYKSNFSFKIDNVEELIESLTTDELSNLDLVLRLLGQYTLATTGMIITNENANFEKIVSFGKEVEISDALNIIKKPTKIKNFIINPNMLIENEKFSNSKEAKVVICIPIQSSSKKPYTNIENEKRQFSSKKMDQILGYIYLETDKFINNFTNKALDQCQKTVPLVSILLESHNLKVYSSTDKLTGVYVRKHFEKLLEEQVVNSNDSNQPFSIVMCDIDHFKTVNDTFGHQRGDKVLADAGEIILNNLRETDAVGRYGGEEFIILLPGTLKKDAYKVAEKVRKSFKEENLLGVDGDLTISCGISTFPEDGTEKDIIIEKADQALYKAKEEGRNRTISWEKGLCFTDKRVDKLAGIITGNIVQDQRNVLVLTEVIELMTKEVSIDEKIFELVGRLIENLESSEGLLLAVEKEKVTKMYGRRRFNDSWIKNLKYNENLIEKIIRTNQGEYLIDWEDTSNIDVFTGNPNWKSVIVCPIIYDGILKGIIYLSTFAKEKEFDYNAYNLVKITGNIIAPLL
ncbi:diguanylate cyclase [Serpentinicella sp. ANB-PHB4]|uniref:diguanylate cyclase n=1 Tax=Serpentinicella sp. ANB-PHB4 TaxID=3074076 RepID=UPI002864EA1B|nr:diguanylate cyclase [Serpentinicella sp. ANB-PHB4]MDR5657938.1 diguanylate cyclase [Serpentinicella sp. ANB-PHB4]